MINSVDFTRTCYRPKQHTLLVSNFPSSLGLGVNIRTNLKVLNKILNNDLDRQLVWERESAQIPREQHSHFRLLCTKPWRQSLAHTLTGLALSFYSKIFWAICYCHQLCHWPTIHTMHILVLKICLKVQVLSSHFSEACSNFVNDLLNEHWAKYVLCKRKIFSYGRLGCVI